MDSNVETTNIYSHPELLVVADTVAREKGIDREEVLEAMEQAIQKAGRSKYGHEHDIRAEIDSNSGETTNRKCASFGSASPDTRQLRSAIFLPTGLLCEGISIRLLSWVLALTLSPLRIAGGFRGAGSLEC